MKEMTSREILEAIDRAMKKVAERFAKGSEVRFGVQGSENEASKAFMPVIAAGE